MRRLKVYVLLAVVLVAAYAVAGPIKGLVDIGTGQEVPDADARYELKGTNTVETSQESVAFAASAEEDWAHTNLAFDAFDLVRGRIWVADTNNNPFDATVTLTWYVDSDRHGEDAVYRADIDLIQVLVNGAVTAGTNTVTVDDASSFAVDQLVVIYDGDSTEYGRIASILSNTITLEDNLSNNVDDNAGFSRVGEYGGFSLYGANQTVWARATFSASQTVNLSNWLEYKK